mmetsp:Transcript_29415/g.87296  ORF Transcript_29415/g.87296 Transcript_29415/m.87296 type:complete len:259 (-) Transcript_29415:71-847(-)
MLLKPDAGLQVQVVRRLVQQKDRRSREERLGQGDPHAPASGHVLRLPVHGHQVVGKAQPGEDLPRARLGPRGVELLQAVGDRLYALVLRAALLHDLGLKCLQPFGLLDDVGDDRLHGRVLRGLRLLVQVEDVHVVRHGQVPLRDRRQHVALAAAVVPDEAVAAALVQLNIAVRHELLPAHLHAEVGELHVALGRRGGEDAGDSTSCSDTLLLAGQSGRIVTLEHFREVRRRVPVLCSRLRGERLRLERLRLRSHRCQN